MNYIENEQKAFEWFKQNFDSTAELRGGYDSTESDIYSPKLGGYIEVKKIDSKNSARCGQFTHNTRYNNPASIAIMNGNQTQEKLHEFVEYHYKQKQVIAFIVGLTMDTYQLLDYKEFFNACEFSIQSYGKRSGPTQCPLKYQDGIISTHPHFEKREKRLYSPNEEEWGTYFFYNEQEFFISTTNKGEVRKCSNTKNLTYLVVVKIK